MFQTADMAKPRVVTVLQIWMLEQGLTDISLADKVSEKVQPHGHKPVTGRQVGRWRKGLVQPRPYYIAALTELSGGRVDGNSFVEALNKEPPDASESRS